MATKFIFILICTLAIVNCNGRESNKLDNSNKDKNATVVDTASLNLSAKLYVSQHDYEHAYQDYSELVKYDSLNGKYFYGKGFCLLKLKKYAEAERNLLTAVNLNYRICDAYYLLATLNYFLLLNDSLALGYCIKCLKIDPNNQEIIGLKKEIEDKKTI
jgi:tetratricopeptide (TPR) repeat protein